MSPSATYWLVETTTPNGYATVRSDPGDVGAGPSPGVGDTDIVNLADQPVPGTVVINKTGHGGAALPKPGSPSSSTRPRLAASRGGRGHHAAGGCTTNSAGTCSITGVAARPVLAGRNRDSAGYTTVSPTRGDGRSRSVGQRRRHRTVNLTNQAVPGTVVVNKTGQGGAALAGAGFTLYVDAAPTGGARGAEDITAAGGCTTNSAGTCSILNVPLGQYWLVETTTPNGYATITPTAVTVGLGPSAGVGDTDTITSPTSRSRARSSSTRPARAGRRPWESRSLSTSTPRLSVARRGSGGHDERRKLRHRRRR